MTWYEDGTPCEYAYTRVHPGNCVAVGWLGKGKHFETGETPPHLIERLNNLLDQAKAGPTQWGPDAMINSRMDQFFGHHQCEICEDSTPYFDSGELLVPDTEIAKVWGAPYMIVHYIIEHGYRPPEPFLDALLRSPEIWSHEYFDQMDDFSGVDWRDRYLSGIYYNNSGALGDAIYKSDVLGDAE
jgi:hypothetical protein